MDHWSNKKEGGSRSGRRRNCPSDNLSNADSTCTGLGLNPGLREEASD